jgi:hypothetical protein
VDLRVDFEKYPTYSSQPQSQHLLSPSRLTARANAKAEWGKPLETGLDGVFEWKFNRD